MLEAKMVTARTTKQSNSMRIDRRYHLNYNFQLQLHALRITPSRSRIPENFPGNKQKKMITFERTMSFRYTGQLEGP